MNKCYILHIIAGDKFTSGYVNFMKKYMKKEQFFWIIGEGFKYNFCDDENIEIIKGRELVVKSENRKRVQEAEKIIVSGVIDGAVYLGLFPNEILAKVYLHFWGGDFYCLRDKISIIHIRSYIYRIFRLRCIKRCRALVFLLDTEQAQFEKICKYRKRCMAAAMPKDPMEEIDYERLMNEIDKKVKEKRIIVGNSATKENHHIEVFELLARYKDKNMKVYVPLSYGNMDYKEEVIRKGRELLGDIFIPIENYMEKREYCRLLASMDVGIFNNDRQQAMGNIGIMLRMGKKLYLRKGTSMWESFLAAGAILHDAAGLRQSTYEDLFRQDMNDKQKNIQAIEAIWNVKGNVEQWEKIIY